MIVKRNCPEPGCTTLVLRGRCARHLRPAWQHTASRHARGYGSAWITARRAVLKEEPCCRACGSEDRPTVDHIIPKAQGGTNHRANLQRLCATCQQTKATHESHAARVH